jgi:hypothetical protein
MNSNSQNLAVGRRNPAAGVHIHLDESYSAKWLYVQENPIRKGLAKQIADWPFKGTIHLLTW